MSKFSCFLHHVPQKLLWPSCSCRGIIGGGDSSQSVLPLLISSSSCRRNYQCPSWLNDRNNSSGGGRVIVGKSGWKDGCSDSELETSASWTSFLTSSSRRKFAVSSTTRTTTTTVGEVAARMAKAPPVVFCGPSGAGKSTLVKKLLEEFSDVFGFSISHTTRKPRAGEQDGRDYYFVTREVMEEAIKQGEFIEHAEFSGNLYGTSKRAVEDVQKKGKMCILDIDTQGVKQIKKTNLQPRLIFIKPPSLQDLENRLRLRGTETEETLKRRLAVAQSEMEYGEAPGNFDLVLINDQVEPAYQKLRAFLLPDITELRNFLAKSNPSLAYQNGSGDKN